MNDIDLSGYGNWDPIGHIDLDSGDITPFSGIFDGNGHVIKNMTIRHPEVSDFDTLNPNDLMNYNNLGLFRAIGDGEVKNLGIENVDIYGFGYLGGLVGSMENSTVTNCYVTGNIEQQLYSGGLIGVMENSVVENCYTNCNISLIDVNAPIGAGGAGGLVCTGSGEIKNCYTTGTIETNQMSGGLVDGFNGTISNCYSIMKIIEVGTSPRKNGALVGNGVDSIKNCYYNKDTSGVTDAIGNSSNVGQVDNVQGLSTSEMKAPSNWSGWDSNIWDFSSYPPTLKNMPKSSASTNPGGDTDPDKPGGGGAGDEPIPGAVRLQIGSDSSSTSAIYVDTSFDLGAFDVDFSSADSCAAAIEDIDEVLSRINTKRSEFGAVINRLSSILESQTTTIQNFTSAKSTIMDADIANESADFVKNQILQQTSSALLAQSQNLHASIVLSLIG